MEAECSDVHVYTIASCTNSFTPLSLSCRWDDDVVFKNCAKAEPRKVQKLQLSLCVCVCVCFGYFRSVQDKGFINDTIRSEFHKKFMDKYVK